MVNNKTYFKISLLAITLVLLLATLLSGCSSLQSLLQNPKYLYENGAVLVDGADKPIELKNNPKAVDETYAQVLDFIRQDTTDLLPYIDRGNKDGLTPFVCSDFAARVHDNAEAAGIRAGYVSVDWVSGDVGHAIDAFETTDQGLVFIDCTGKSDYSQVEEGDSQVTMGSWDKVGYLATGHQYGVIALAYAASPQFAYYDVYSQKWQELKDKLTAYNAEVRSYNQQIKGHVYTEGSTEIASIRDWEARLTQEENDIIDLQLEVGESRFKPLGIVSNYEVHW